MLKFYAVEHGYHDSWEIHYVLATSAEDAADRYIKRRKNKLNLHDSMYTIEAEVYETDFDEYGVLQRQWDMNDEAKILRVLIPD